jgi:hypothetical protein
MPFIQEQAGVLRTCPCCGIRFPICKSCWRGHWYCGPRCVEHAKIQSRARANRRYRLSEVGKLRQRLAQREYRKRLKKSVRDHSSKLSTTSLIKSSLNHKPKEEVRVFSMQCCSLCGRKVNFFIDGRRFPRPKYRQRKRGGT